MSDRPLSQDEINALLQGLKEDEPSEPEKNDQEHETVEITDILTPMEQDTIGEIGNISFGSSATALSTLLNQKVEITTPTVTSIDQSTLHDLFPHPHVVVHVDYTEGFEGSNLFVITTKDAAIIADLMLGGTGEKPDETLTDMHLSAVQEAMNQMMGSASTSMSTLFNRRVDISPPRVQIVDFNTQKKPEYVPEGDHLIGISFSLKLGELIDSQLLQIINVPFGKSYAQALLGETHEVEETHVEKKESIKEPTYFQQHEEPNRVKQPTPTMAKEQLVEKAVFSNFEKPNLPDSEMKNLDMLLDIPLEVKVELGRTKKTIQEILTISQGSIIELDKLAGEPVDVRVNDRLIAKGEVVVIDENFGVRITDIVSKKERINHLN
ncbi:MULTISPECIES: flagellar motor switch phosphatase FliY [Bacillaceae]|uniref:Flagellar motor switch protein FliN n=1 Tax=Alkalicoccobacillus plakortidis TaxID=444060 RepID=A0A9D5DTS1_9BACI|nr:MULTISPECIES: flagellar motor switch phosphatase FliY [Bacillaceae]KQL58646.1 flagellar motor switch protein FliN [Alkalicoccobacillus plakortidis]